MKFHMSGDVLKECTADRDPCPKGENTPHFVGEKDEAELWAESQNEKAAGGTFASLRKNVSKPLSARKPPHGLGDRWKHVSIPDYADGSSFTQRWNERFEDLAEWEQRENREFSSDDVERARDGRKLIPELPESDSPEGEELMRVEPEQDNSELPQAILDDEELKGKYIYAVRTRQGGMRRTCYCPDDDHDCAVQVNDDFQSHPKYLADEDDVSGKYGATFYFRVDKTEEEVQEHLDGQRRATALLEDKKLQERVNEGKLTPWAAVSTGDTSPEYRAGDLQRISQSLRESKEEKDRLDILSEKAERADLDRSDISAMSKEFPGRFDPMYVLESVHRIKEAEEQHAKAQRLYAEAEKFLPENSELREHLLGDRGPTTYKTSEKRGRQTVNVEKTLERGSVLGSEVKHTASALKRSKELFASHEWSRTLEKDREKARQAIIEGVKQYQKKEPERRASWSHGWPDPAAPQPPAPYDY